MNYAKKLIKNKFNNKLKKFNIILLTILDFDIK